jgi:hypothetical protein
MHDETFYITQGTVRFHVPDPDHPGKDKEVLDASVGDYVTVPIRSPHTFSNPTDQEAKLVFTSTPAFYINYFKLLSRMGDAGKPMPAEANIQAMALYATTLVDEQPRKSER